MTCKWCKGRELNDHDCNNFPDEIFLERTDEAQKEFDAKRPKFCSWCRQHPCLCDEDIEAACDLENPESCESCQ